MTRRLDWTRTGGKSSRVVVVTDEAEVATYQPPRYSEAALPDETGTWLEQACGFSEPLANGILSGVFWQ